LVGCHGQDPPGEARVEKLTKDLLSVGKSEDAEKVANRLETFTKEATSAKPDEDFLKITGEGLIEAAKAVAGMADPIFQVVTKILAFFP